MKPWIPTSLSWGPSWRGAIAFFEVNNGCNEVGHVTEGYSGLPEEAWLVLVEPANQFTAYQPEHHDHDPPASPSHARPVIR
eukprot:942137-Rhodomonas_salina.1